MTSPYWPEAPGPAALRLTMLRHQVEDAAFATGWCVHAGKLSRREAIQGLRRMAERVRLPDSWWVRSYLDRGIRHATLGQLPFVEHPCG